MLLSEVCSVSCLWVLLLSREGDVRRRGGGGGFGSCSRRPVVVDNYLAGASALVVSFFSVTFIPFPSVSVENCATELEDLHCLP